jgi:hypothetical protein
VSEDCTTGLGGIKETSGIVAGGLANGGFAGVSTDGGEVEAGSDTETWGRFGNTELVDPSEPMLRAATSVVGMTCDSIAAFFGGLGSGLGRAFPFDDVKKFTSAWTNVSLRFHASLGASKTPTSIRQPRSRASDIISFHVLSLRSRVGQCPNTNSEARARVNATFIRRTST